MKHLNEHTIVGTVGSKFEKKTFDSGTRKLKCRVVTDRQLANGKKISDWHNCIFWDNLADIVEKYVAVGQGIWLRGRSSTRDYKDKNDNSASITEVHVRDMIMLSSKGGEADDPGFTPQELGFDDQIEDDLS